MNFLILLRCVDYMAPGNPTAVSELGLLPVTQRGAWRPSVCVSYRTDPGGCWGPLLTIEVDVALSLHVST